MLFDKKERAGRKHLVFYDMVLYNNEVFQTGREIKHGKTPVLRDARLDKTVFGGMAAVEKEKCAMAKPVLVIMAAGMGSRYGGLKQIDPVGPNGQIILDYSIYDAHRAGFERVVFIIRPELHEAFEHCHGSSRIGHIGRSLKKRIFGGVGIPFGEGFGPSPDDADPAAGGRQPSGQCAPDPGRRTDDKYTFHGRKDRPSAVPEP